MTAASEASHSSPPTRAGLREVWAAFGKLGLTSFGGPVAHLGFFRSEFVTKRRWLSDADFADLVALCQFLPGPASSQMVFALGTLRAGLPGALLASLLFTLPSALLMIMFAYGVSALNDMARAGWIHGLKLAAVAVVAQALWGMSRTLCTDWPRRVLCGLVAVTLLLVPGALVQVGVIAAGGLLGWCWYHRRMSATPKLAAPVSRRTHLVAAGALTTFFLLLVLLPLLAAAYPYKPLQVFDSFYRSGSLVFGGGHVVLPLLRAEVVPPGWLNNLQFLAGYGAAQAVPGPLFTFSAYLGTAMQPGANGWLNGLWCLLAIFLPAWLLIAGALPFWQRLRGKVWAQAFLRGANAAVVGVLLVALYQPVITESVFNLRDAALALWALGALLFWRIPPWALVLIMAALGQWLL
jgi:chromate transporter